MEISNAAKSQEINAEPVDESIDKDMNDNDDDIDGENYEEMEVDQQIQVQHIQRKVAKNKDIARIEAHKAAMKARVNSNFYKAAVLK